MNATSVIRSISGDMPVAEQAVVSRLREALEPLARVRGLEVVYCSPGGAAGHLFGGAEPVGAPAARFPCDCGSFNFELLLHDSGADACARELAELAIQGELSRMEIEKREELLLDELSTNWESLETLYEISTNVLRFGDIKSALQRLVERLVSLQDGLEAAVFVTRHGRLAPLAASCDGIEPVQWQDLGPLETPIRESRAALLNTIEGGFAWRSAARVAAAPITARPAVIGAVIVWRNDRRFEFDAPFSRLLEALTYQASMLLESDRLNRTMRENERLAQEIEIASSIQQTLLFGHAPAHLPGMELACFSFASRQIDGDFYDFLKHSPDCVDVLIGDVMGKGVGAALLGAASKSQFLRALSNLAVARQTAPEPVEIVRRAASRLCERFIELERFVTICYARFDLKRRVVEYVDCGHTGLILYRRRTDDATFLRGDDLPIGVMPRFECEQHSIGLMPGDMFLLFSDGITEARDPDGEFFGEERLIDCVRTWSSLGPDILLGQIRRSLHEFTGGRPPGDDCTGVAVHIKIDDSREPVSTATEQFECDLNELSRVREWIGSRASLSGETEPEELARLELACAELFVNCVRHGSSETCREPVNAGLRVFPDHVTLEIRHDGPPFDPLAAAAPAFDGSRDGGFGNYIVFRSADALRYHREAFTNIITLSILKRPGSADPMDSVPDRKD